MTLTVTVKLAAGAVMRDRIPVGLRVKVTLISLVYYFIRFHVKGEVNTCSGSRVYTKRTLKRGGAMFTV